ncbi:hypothetical protein [Mesorhizobium xinjiangense]|uniref:hypothetical protein n=1 Tax=Mesorhizobium xinjiangense TaxID=2678685 RepID=UPI0012ED522C|nr:hypothetical protein [Mesorhizobium xinjiangense]
MANQPSFTASAYNDSLRGLSEKYSNHNWAAKDKPQLDTRPRQVPVGRPMHDENSQRGSHDAAGHSDEIDSETGSCQYNGGERADEERKARNAAREPVDAPAAA